MSAVEIFYNEPMAQHTSWRVGGPADIFVLPKSVSELQDFLKTLNSNQKVFWTGLGSNLLVRDGGIRGVVIGTQKFLNDISVLPANVIRAEAGVSCATLARFSARQNLTGIEFLAGVPGTVGGALAMNAGCHGGETWSHVNCVELIDREGNIRQVPAREFRYAYRHVELPKDHAFIAGYFQLQQGEKNKSLETIRELLDYRTRTQPTHEPSCGSTFRNPPNDYAARLIEASGLKNYRIGNAMVSPKHANFIVNLGGASACDIEALIEFIQGEVLSQQQVQLIPEVRVIGEAL